MATRKNTYIEMELDWLDLRAEELRLYCESNPITEITDRVVSGRVVQKKENIIKCIRETLHDYIKIVEAISNLREKEESKKQAIRGSGELTPLEERRI